MPGLELARWFYRDAVAPLIDRYWGGLVYTAARIGTGSEVLGFDTERSADHEWGPRLQFFLLPRGVETHGPTITAMLSERRPKTFMGYPTHFAGEGTVGCMQVTEGPVTNRVEVVEVTDLGSWFCAHMGFDPRETMTTFEWLATLRKYWPR